MKRGIVSFYLNYPLTALALYVACALPAFASALPPCVKAVTSSDGSFLVITEFQLGPENPAQGNLAEVQRVTLQIFPKESFINAKDRITAEATYWTNWMQWSVIIEHSAYPGLGCPVSLITNDGEFVIVLSESAAAATDNALLIYRRPDHLGEPLRKGPDRGVFIKSFTLRELWPTYKFPDVIMVNSATPQWHAGGTFKFSPDSRQLLHTTRLGNAVRINLADGSVSNN